MPRPRKSAKLLAIAGAFAKNPKRARKDVEAAGAIGPWVERSTDPAAIWAELVAECPAGILTAADRKGMEYAVRLMVDLRSDSAAFSASKGSLLVSILAKLGCFPASRLQMSMPDSKEKDDPGEKFFRR
jgi:hypothetical protein